MLQVGRGRQGSEVNTSNAVLIDNLSNYAQATT